jgi:FkbM family methyltransferase
MIYEAPQSLVRNEEYIKKFKTEYTIINNLISSFSSAESPILFDVGAHRGETINTMLAHFEKPIIHAFEPDPSNYAVLKSQFSDMKNVVIVNKGIGATSEERVFYCNKLSHTNSFLKVNDTSTDHIKLQNLNEAEKKDAFLHEYNHEIPVHTISVDDYCQQNNILHIDLLKIDTQGFEIECLKGAARLLSACKVIKCELVLFDYYEKSNSFFEVETILKEYGFILYAIPFVSQNPVNGRTDWVEVIYVNNEII